MQIKTPHKAKGSKKGRKIGRGRDKAAHSRFGSYAGIFGYGQQRKEKRMATRAARLKRLRARRLAKFGGFESRRAMLRAAKFRRVTA